MKKILTYILLFSILPCFASESKDKIMKELRSEIAAAKNRNDSIKLLYDLYDITYQKEEPEVGRMLYNTAGRAGRTDVQLDVLRLLASSVELTEENLQKLIDAAESLPEQPRPEGNCALSAAAAYIRPAGVCR